MKNKKIPMRMCISCKEMKQKKQLIRIVNNKEKGLLVDLSGKISGKGAYICSDDKCLNKLKKTNYLNKVFSQEVDAKIYEDLEDAIEFVKKQ